MVMEPSISHESYVTKKKMQNCLQMTCLMRFGNDLGQKFGELSRALRRGSSRSPETKTMHFCFSVSSHRQFTLEVDVEFSTI